MDFENIPTRGRHRSVNLCPSRGRIVLEFAHRIPAPFELFRRLFSGGVRYFDNTQRSKAASFLVFLVLLVFFIYFMSFHVIATNLPCTYTRTAK
ncbi:hypothetical protein BOTBODRAFT_430591 [Botryobasidium botryosum FD-172 SS1]|uniref:Uncharacterized protein n=1 Tax=Botryobasidium botryosum (strain FD-172 SS1) TaxID=930990 RepID=A0A067MJL3_BOTB1|nr:hypothetical protein BOTBODRAFT_430591 [Botryobasidium botryosum FD-172 SS1]